MNDLEVKPASTVVLFERDAPWPTKTLLLRRSPKAKFLPGAHVFPGGAVDEKDYKQESVADNACLLARTRQYFPFNERKIIGHLAAAVRETKEEAGLTINPGELRPLSWWVTPLGEALRFDTWFFLAPICPKSLIKPIPETDENQQPLLAPPQEALDLHERRSIFLAPPTRSILERMAMAHSVEEFISYVDQPLKPIHPLFILEDGQKILILPGHSRHPEQKSPTFLMKTSYHFF